ncbi:MAG: FliO/MopB family protein [Gaiellaceae bacterium]
MCSGRPRRSHAVALVAFAASLLVVAPQSAAAASGFQRDNTPLPAGVTHANTAAVSHGTGSGPFFRMVVGLAIVLALIYVVYRLLKRFSNREATVRDIGAMSIVATTQLSPARALHLLRVGDELVLVGSAEHGVTPIRVYSAEEARRLEVDSPSPPRSLAPAAFRVDEQPGGFVSNMLEELRRRTVRR